jgi:hypothetical protein
MTAKQNIRHLVSTAVLLGAMTLPATALEISKHGSDNAHTNAVLLKGTIVDGDAYEVKRYIAKLPKKANVVVYLDSPGGNLREGLKLGSYFYEFKIETVVANKALCTSACALAFLGGRDAKGEVARTKYTTGRVGYHAFSREFNENVTYSANDLKTVLLRTQFEVFNIAQYLRSIETDMDVLRIMLSAPPQGMAFISDDTAIEIGVRVFDAKLNKPVDPAPVLERLAKARADAKLAAAQPPVPAPPAPASAKADGGAPEAKPTASVVPPAAPAAPAALPALPKAPVIPTLSQKPDSSGRAG